MAGRTHKGAAARLPGHEDGGPKLGGVEGFCISTQEPAQHLPAHPPGRVVDQGARMPDMHT